MWGLFKKFYQFRFVEKQPFVIMDIPLLFESGFFKYILYPIIVVSIHDESIIIKRLMERNKFTEDQAISRIRA